jgi:hypothetical protein
MKIIERIFDASTGQTTDIERDMTKAEMDQAAKDAAEASARSQAEAQKATAKAALLERLGITADEAALLLS